MIESQMLEVHNDEHQEIEGELLSYSAMFPRDDSDSETHHPLMAFKAMADKYTMYLHQAMKEPDKEKSLEAIKKEVDDQMSNGNFTIIPRSQVPKGKTVLPDVCQMNCKRDIKIRHVKNGRPG